MTALQFAMEKNNAAEFEDPRDPIEITYNQMASIMIAYLHHATNTPEINDFIKGVGIEARHQQERWGDQSHEPFGHFMLVANKLMGKMAIDIFDDDRQKLKHHIIALAAVMKNLHDAVSKQD